MCSSLEVGRGYGKKDVDTEGERDGYKATKEGGGPL